MPVQETFSTSSLPSVKHRLSATRSTTRTSTIPRIKSAATALLRHGYKTPSTHISESKHHNSLNLACKLPDEALQQLFLTCAAIAVAESAAWSWVSVSHVCSNWRRVALQSPEIWRFVDFSHPRWYKLTWARAKMSSLHVIATVTDNNIRQLRRTLELAHRIQDIHLISPFEKVRPLLEILTNPNPSLESLIIDISSSTLPETSHMYETPLFLTSYTAPPLTNLKYVELRNAPLFLVTPRCTHLTHLHLHDLPSTERPTLRQLLTILERLSYLRSLVLDRSFPSNIESDDTHDLRIHLPKLQYITLVGNIREITRMLDCITFPPSAHLIGEISSLSPTPTELRELTDSIAAFACAVTNSGPLEILALKCLESSERYTSLFLPNPEYRQSLRIRAFTSTNNPVIDLTITPAVGDESDELLISALSAVWESLPLEHVHTMALQDMDIITQSSWRAYLERLPCIRVVDISGRAPSGFAWALLLNARASGKRYKKCKDPPPILIPNLEDMYLHNVDCSSGGFMVSPAALINSHRDLDDSRFLDVLIASLHQRRRRAFCLRSLCIARCDYVLQSMVQEAHKAVSNLVWDFYRVMKEKDVGALPARYPSAWHATGVKLRHYHRLRALKELDDGMHSVAG